MFLLARICPDSVKSKPVKLEVVQLLAGRAGRSFTFEGRCKGCMENLKTRSNMFVEFEIARRDLATARREEHTDTPTRATAPKGDSGKVGGKLRLHS